MVAAGHSPEVGDESIGKVEPAATCGECGSDDGLLVDPELPGVEEALDRLGTASGTELVRPAQDPVQLDDGDQAEEPRSFSVSASITVETVADWSGSSWTR